MTTRHFVLMTATAAVLSLTAGCELIVNFDRSKIDEGTADTGMPEPDSGMDSGMDSGTDAGEDAGMDGSIAMPDGGMDASMVDASMMDGSMPDASTMDAALDANMDDDAGF